MVLAVGTDASVGEWRITSYRSPGLTDAGEVLEPAGLPCLKLVIRGRIGAVGRSYCGERGELSAADLLLADPSGREFHVLFGRAPETGQGVGLVTPRGARRAQVHEGPPDFSGDAWILVTPRERGAGRFWIDSAAPGSATAGERVDVTLQISRPGDAHAIG